MPSRGQKPIPVGDLTEALLCKYPVWEFTNSDEFDDTAVRPVKKLPVTSGNSRLFGCEIRFADGSMAFGLIGNLSLEKPEENQHFLTLTVFFKGKEYGLSRYHDFNFGRNGPDALAKKIGKNKEAIFPMRYDLSAVAVGAAASVRGTIRVEPNKKLSRDELIRLAVRG